MTMTIALWCILAAGFLHLPFVGAAKFGGGRFDNNNPRDFLAGLDGWRKRANAVQLNSFEAFPLFAAAVIVAHLLHADQGRVDTLALAFLALRVVYGVLYLANLATLRSIAWIGAQACVIALFVISA